MGTMRRTPDGITFTMKGKGPTAIVTVFTEHGSKPTQRGDEATPIEWLVRRMAREIEADAAKR